MSSIRRLFRNGSLSSNAFMLYALMFSNYIVYFLTIPYQARVLGPELFGLVSFAMALTAYFQIFIDFGFMYSGVESITRARKNTKQASLVYSAIMAAKFILLALSAVIFVGVCIFTPVVREHILLFALFFVGNSLKSFIPDFVYRGLEDMRSIAVRVIVIQVLFAVSLFMFLRSPEDYLVIPLLVTLASVLSLVFIVAHLRGKDIFLILPKVKDVIAALNNSKLFFFSRASSYIYSTSNVLLAGVVYGPISSIVGYYTSADRLVAAIKQLINPVSDSLYPYMVRRKNYYLLSKIVILASLITVALVACLVIFADTITAIIFGEDYRSAGVYFALLSISASAVIVGQLFGYSMLAPVGKAHHVNISAVVGLCVHAICVIILFFTGSLTVIALCVASCITEFCVLGYRVGVTLKNRKQIFPSMQ